jgi:hypothetical protein
VRTLLLSPVRPVFTNTFRLPPVQDPTGAIARNLHDTLMDRDALRRIKTTARNRKLSGGINTPQQFVRATGGSSNDPAAMATGAHKMNARRLVNKTASSSSAGM